MMPVCSISYLFYGACVFYKLFILWCLCSQAYGSFYSLKGKPCPFCPQVSLFMRFTAYTRSKKIATKYMYFCIEKIVGKPCKRVLLFMQIVKGPPVNSNSTLSSLAAEYCIAKTSGFACNLHFAKIKHANDNLPKKMSSIADIFPDFSHIFYDSSSTKLLSGVKK